jgi:nucleotidyltransferase/DNA polymerase involved in DNA repair
VRIACLVVPLFPLAARLRCEPELAGESTAVVEGNGPAARIIAATRPARLAGIKPGMTLSQTRALVPGMTVRSRGQESERAAQEVLLEIAESVSPRVEDAGEGIVYLDITGLEGHFPGDQPERDLMLTLMARGEALDLPLWTAAAASKLAARIAADLPNSPIVVPSSQEAGFLAPLPLDHLSPQIETALTLQRWGLHSIGDLARLPPDEVASRLGAVGRELHQRARGLDSRPLVPRQPQPSFREGMELEWPLVNLEGALRAFGPAASSHPRGQNPADHHPARSGEQAPRRAGHGLCTDRPSGRRTPGTTIPVRADDPLTRQARHHPGAPFRPARQGSCRFTAHH